VLKHLGDMDKPEAEALVLCLNAALEEGPHRAEAVRLLEDPRVLRAVVLMLWDSLRRDVEMLGKAEPTKKPR